MGGHKGQPIPGVHEEVIRATYVMLLKSDPKSIALAVRALSSLEVAFNHQYHYPLVVFYENSFEEVHRQQLYDVFSGNITFELVTLATPDFIDQSSIPETITAYSRNFSIGYRHMCRFYAGMIAHTYSLQHYDWMWRIDDDSIYICPIDYDPVRFMVENSKKYGYTIEWQEADEEISWGLWDATHQYMKDHNISDNHMDGYINCVGTYNRCHFWNNFEIVDLRLLRSVEYASYFEYLDKLGGIYYHRWGDALIRTLAMLMLTNPAELHRFTDIGYAHNTACINPCGWQPNTPSEGNPCTHLPTGRDVLCDPPHRYFVGHPRAIYIEVVIIRVMWTILAAGVLVMGAVGYKRFQHRALAHRLRTE